MKLLEFKTKNAEISDRKKIKNLFVLKYINFSHKLSESYVLNSDQPGQLPSGNNSIGANYR